jgi:YHS domain-containing protein
MIRFVITLFFLYLVFRLCRTWFRALTGARREEPPAADQEAELIRDPQCGSYFLKQRGVSASVRGETVHFCSPACRDRYLRRRA